LGESDSSLLAHLAGDPQRILEVAVNYMNLGLYADALDVLSRTYPTAADVVSEPGMPSADSYPLIAYYRGYCRYKLNQDGRADFEAASRMPTTYVFPNRAESFAVLHRALEVNPQDATAHFLLGSLFLSSDEPQQAMEQWELARQINPSIPTLQRNMGYTVLYENGPLDKAIELFREGTKYDSHNVDVYLGLEEALKKAGRSAEERAQALASFPDMQSAPATLVFKAAELFAEAGQFDRAEKLLQNRFFPREEGGKTSGEVYVQIRLQHASSAASRHNCTEASSILKNLADPNATVPGTSEKIAQYTQSDSAKQSIRQIRAACP
jgi:tetratricopeptide (TPR) repeat protein